MKKLLSLMVLNIVMIQGSINASQRIDIAFDDAHGTIRVMSPKRTETIGEIKGFLVAQGYLLNRTSPNNIELTLHDGGALTKLTNNNETIAYYEDLIINQRKTALKFIEFDGEYFKEENKEPANLRDISDGLTVTVSGKSTPVYLAPPR